MLLNTNEKRGIYRISAYAVTTLHSNLASKKKNQIRLMKRTILPALLLLLIVGYSEAKPQTYYWVVESNINSPDSSIIRIYNQQHELVYTEKVEGKVLNPSNKRVVKRLNRKARKVKSLQENSNGFE